MVLKCGDTVQDPEALYVWIYSSFPDGYEGIQVTERMGVVPLMTVRFRSRDDVRDYRCVRDGLVIDLDGGSQHIPFVEL
jgi:hypothetical protein